jgi:hypothetical protein
MVQRIVSCISFEFVTKSGHVRKQWISTKLSGLGVVAPTIAQIQYSHALEGLNNAKT